MGSCGKDDGRSQDESILFHLDTFDHVIINDKRFHFILEDIEVRKSQKIILDILWIADFIFLGTKTSDPWSFGGIEFLDLEK